MSWTALACVAVIVVLIFISLVVWSWPRGADGKRIKAEELKDYIKRHPASDSEMPPAAIAILHSIIFMLALIGVALTRRD